MLTQEFLLQRYGTDEPFFAFEFSKEDQESLMKLCEQGQILRFLDSYYIKSLNFTQSFFEERYIIKKYITDGTSIYGFKSGNYLKSILGIPHISTRTRVIYSSMVKEREELELAGFHNIILTVPIKVDTMNARIIQFLDFFNFITYEEAIENKDKIIEYIQDHHFSALQRNMYFHIMSNYALKTIINGNFYYQFEDFEW